MARTQFQKEVLEAMVTWMSKGYSLPVLRFIIDCHSGEKEGVKVDAALSRHFVARALESEAVNPVSRRRFRCARFSTAPLGFVARVR